MESHLENFIHGAVPYATVSGRRVAIAVSGGGDSMALLHILRRRDIEKPNVYREMGIVALTVEHGLRPESATEAKMVHDYCNKIGVEHHILKWDGAKPKNGIEQAARKARYGLMTDWCLENKVRVLVVAHQRDDNIETFFMNLARGSGIYGLSGMTELSWRKDVIFWRPLLKVPKVELEKYCADNDVPFIRDPMNDDESFTRVKIRKNRAALGLSDKRIALAIENLRRVQDIIENEVSRIHELTNGTDFATFNPIEFYADDLLGNYQEVKMRALAEMLTREDGYVPRLNAIKKAIERLESGDSKFTLAGYNIRRLGDKIRIWPEGTKFPDDRKIKK